MVHQEISSPLELDLSDISHSSDFEVRKKMDAGLKRKRRVRRAMQKNEMKTGQHSFDTMHEELVLPAVNTTPRSTQSSSGSIPPHVVPQTETEAVVVTPHVSIDTETDIQKILGANEDSQEDLLYSPQEQEYRNFLKEMEENSSCRTPSEIDFSSWMRSLEESFEQHSIHPRQLFPESPKKPTPRKQVAFSKDNTVRFFSRTKEELMQLRRKKKKHINNDLDDFDEWPLFRYLDEKLKTIEDYFIQEQGCLCQDAPTASFQKDEEEPAPAVPMRRVSPLADDLVPDDENDDDDDNNNNNNVEVEAPKEESFQSKNSDRNTSNNSGSSDNSGISGLWFAVPYKSPSSPSHDANLDFIHPVDPKGFPFVNDSLLDSDLDNSILSNGSNGKNTSLNSSFSIARKKKVVEAAKRWAASQKDFFDKAHEGLGIVAKATEITAETSRSSSPEDGPDLDKSRDSSNSSSLEDGPDQKEVVEAAKRWAASQKDFFDKAHEGLGIVAKATEITAETSRSSSPEDGPDLDESRDSSNSSSLEDGPELDESMDWKEEPKSDTQESKEWEVAEFGPDLDEARGLRYHQEDPDLGLSEEWESFEWEVIADSGVKVTQKAAVDDADWLPFPFTTAEPTVFQDAPDMDEAKGWKPFQEEVTPEKTIQSRYQSAPRKKWRQRIAKSRLFHEASLNHVVCTIEKEALSKRVVELADAACISKSVKELARAIELRASPTNESVVSPLTVETWADERKENPTELPTLQFPVLDSAQPSPVSVALS